jgi:cytochrome c553
MKKVLVIATLLAATSAFAMNYAQTYGHLCAKCHGKDGEKKARKVGGPFSKFSQGEIEERIRRFINGEVVETPRTSRLMTRVLKKAKLHKEEDIKGMAAYIKTLQK